MTRKVIELRLRNGGSYVVGENCTEIKVSDFGIASVAMTVPARRTIIVPDVAIDAVIYEEDEA